MITPVSRQQKGSVGAVGSIATNAQAHVTGNLLVALISRQSNTAITVTDTAGNTYQQLGSDYMEAGNTNRLAIWYAYDITGHASNVVTAALTSGTAGYFMISVREFSGFGSADPGGASAGADGNGTAPTTASLAVTGPEAVIVAIVEADLQSIVAGSGFTGDDIDGIGFFLDEEKIVTAAEEADATCGSGDWRILGGVFNAPASTWYSGSWAYRVKVTVSAAQVDADLTDFPVYVDLSTLPADFHTHVKTDGSDIRVTSADGVTEIPREVVAYDSGADTGEMHFKAPAISNTVDTDFYIYYGNAGASEPAINATYGAENVWTNSYKAVYHMQQDPSGNGAGAVKDSTANANHLTPSGAPVLGTGKLGGRGIVFDGTDDQLKDTDQVWPNANNAITVQMWNNFASADDAANRTVYRYTTTGGGRRNSAHAPWSGEAYFDFGDLAGNGRINGSYTAYDDKYSLLHFVSNGTTSRRIYIDGVVRYNNDTTADAPDADQTGLAIGSGIDTEYHKATLDEVRISTVARSADWIDAENTNQATPGTFYAVGSEESNPTGDPGLQADLYEIVQRTTFAITAEYEVRAEVPLSKAAEYEVRSEHNVPKDLDYMVRTEVGVAIDLDYAVSDELVVTKGAVYAVTAEAGVALDADYMVKTEGSAALDADYAVTIEEAIQKGATYAVTAEAGETKPLDYEVTIEAAIQKAAQYTVLTEVLTQIAAAYEVETPITVVGIEKDLDYVVTSEQSIAKDLEYQVTDEAGIQVALQYAVAHEEGITVGLTYEVTAENVATLPLEYEVTNDAAITKPATYRVTTELLIQKSALYEVTSEQPIQKDAEYQVTAENALQVAMDYLVAVPRELTKAMTYAVVSTAWEVKNLAYRVAVQEGITLPLEYEIQLQERLTKDMQYQVKTQPQIEVPMTYVVRFKPYTPKVISPYQPKEGPYTRKTTAVILRRVSPYSKKPTPYRSI